MSGGEFRGPHDFGASDRRGQSSGTKVASNFVTSFVSPHHVQFKVDRKSRLVVERRGDVDQIHFDTSIRVQTGRMKVGIILPNWIGDVVMATPTLRALRRYLGPESQLIGVMRPYVEEVLRGTPWLDQTLFYEKRSARREHRFSAVLQQLQAERLDAILMLNNSLRTAWLAWRSGAIRRIGYVRNGRGPLLTDRLYSEKENGKWKPISAVDFFLETAYTLGCPEEELRLELATTESEEAGAAQAWEQLGLGAEVIAFNTGGAKGAAKHWPMESYIELAKQIVTERREAQVLVLCGPAEQQAASHIVREVNHSRVVSMAEQDLSLGVSKAIIRRSQLLVSTDSGPRHIGHAFDVPVITMFGSIDPRWSETYHSKAVTMMHKVPCGPCGKAECSVPGHPCMTGLSVDRVMNAVRHQMSRYVDRCQVA